MSFAKVRHCVYYSNILLPIVQNNGQAPEIQVEQYKRWRVQASDNLQQCSTNGEQYTRSASAIPCSKTAYRVLPLGVGVCGTTGSTLGDCFYTDWMVCGIFVGSRGSTTGSGLETATRPYDAERQSAGGNAKLGRDTGSNGPLRGST